MSGSGVSDTAQQRGQLAEALAARFLQAQGCTLLARNFRVKGGEIDLIARDGETLLFVEVRLRRSQAFGGAAASITPTKQRRIILVARHYLARWRGEVPDCRFDCLLLDRLEMAAMVWVKGAFEAG